MPTKPSLGCPCDRELFKADVLAVVDASTAVNTKAAYRSDWARFTGWAGERGFTALPTDALVVAHYVTEAAAVMTVLRREAHHNPR